MYRWLLIFAIVFLVASWTLFVVAFFLPAYDAAELPDTQPGTPLTGWQSMLTSFISCFAMPLLLLIEPRFCIFLIIPFTNFAALMSPILVAGLREDCWIIAPFLVMSGAMAWCLPAPIYDHLLIGFYCWNLSHFAMALAAVILAGLWARMEILPVPVNTT